MQVYQLSLIVADKKIAKKQVKNCPESYRCPHEGSHGYWLVVDTSRTFLYIWDAMEARGICNKADADAKVPVLPGITENFSLITVELI